MAHVHSHSEDKHYDSMIPTLIEEEGELRIDPELEGWQLLSGRYTYPCAECRLSTIVEDPYNFDSTDHTCGKCC